MIVVLEVYRREVQSICERPRLNSSRQCRWIGPATAADARTNGFRSKLDQHRRLRTSQQAQNKVIVVKHKLSQTANSNADWLDILIMRWFTTTSRLRFDVCSTVVRLRSLRWSPISAPWVKKGSHYSLVHNFTKCRPIFKILSLLESALNL